MPDEPINITTDILIAIREDISSFRAAVDKRFDAVEDGLERIEKLMLVDHKRRIERLEEQVKDLRDLLAIK